MAFIIAKKVNMTQVFTEDGRVIPVTVLAALPARVSKVLTEDRDKYKAVAITSGKTTREFRVADGEYKPDQDIKVSDFVVGDVIDVRGTTKGRGTAGVMKRHGFHGAPATHGHDHPRAPGSIGSMFPQHVRKGTRMAGHMGAVRQTAKNSVVVAVDASKNLMLVKGSIPGAPNTLLSVVTTGKKKELGKLADFSSKPDVKPEAKPEPKKEADAAN